MPYRSTKPRSSGVAGEVLVRKAVADDLAHLVDLYRHLTATDPAVGLDEAEQIFETFHRYPGSAIFVAEVDGVLASSCALIVIPNLTRAGAPYALIENVVTHSDHRKRGHARRVLDAAVDAAWAAGCYKAMLMTGSTTPGTHAFYRAIGFEQTKTGYQKRRIPVREE